MTTDETAEREAWEKWAQDPSRPISQPFVAGFRAGLAHARKALIARLRAMALVRLREKGLSGAYAWCEILLDWFELELQYADDD